MPWYPKLQCHGILSIASAHHSVYDTAHLQPQYDHNYHIVLCHSAHALGNTFDSKMDETGTLSTLQYLLVSTKLQSKKSVNLQNRSVASTV
jgi:hypothetical protein